MMQIDYASLTDMIGAYPVRDLVKVTEVKGPHVSKIYRIRISHSAKQFSLRVTPHINENVLLNELQITEKLLNSSLRTAKLLRTSDGELYAKSANYIATLRVWLGGAHPNPDSITTAKLQDLGRALASFHNSVRDLPYANTDQLVDDDVDKWRSMNYSTIGANVTAPNLWNALGTLEQSQLPKGIVHGDFHARNLLVGKSAVGILDMERSGQGVLLYDISRAAIDLCNAKGVFSPNKSIAFIKGYEEVRKLSILEKSIYPAALAYAALVVSAWFYEHKLQQVGNCFIKAGESVTEYSNQGVLLVE